MVKEGAVNMALGSEHSVTASPRRTVAGPQACPPSCPGSRPWLTSAAGPWPGSGQFGCSEPHPQLGSLISPSLMNQFWGRHSWPRAGISLAVGGSLGASVMAVKFGHAELLGNPSHTASCPQDQGLGGQSRDLTALPQGGREEGLEAGWRRNPSIVCVTDLVLPPISIFTASLPPLGCSGAVGQASPCLLWTRVDAAGWSASLVLSVLSPA